MEAVGCLLVGLGPEVSGCRTPRVPWASAGSLLGRGRVQKTPELLRTHWWVKPGPGISAELLAGRAVSQSLAAEPRDPRAGVRLLVQGVDS